MSAKNFKTVFPHIFVFLTFCLTMSLGIWQIQRLSWKQELIEKLEKNLELEALTSIQINNLDEQEFRVLREKGYYDFTHEMEVLHQTYNGKLGTYAITPFKANSGKVFLVNRGWTEYEHKHTNPQGEVEVFGVIRKSPRQGNFALQNEPQKNLWYNIDLEQMSKVAGGTETDFYIELKSESDESPKNYPYPLPKKIQVYNEHVQYIITWFGISIALLVIYYFRFFRKQKPQETITYVSRKNQSKK